MSELPRNGSHTSVTSSGVSVDTSSHDHFLFSLRSIPNLSTWLYDVQNHRHERIAAGIRFGMAVLTREMMEMHIQQAPDVHGMLDCLPVADRNNMGFIGWRQKLGTWPL
jgi:hypothetical protein